ncbi:MAG: hypothetical protein ACJAX5_000670 [Patiriisocius sp.]|jgi:hypothetical protein
MVLRVVKLLQLPRLQQRLRRHHQHQCWLVLGHSEPLKRFDRWAIDL